MEPILDGRLKAIEAKLNEIEKKVTKIRSVQRTANSARMVYWIFIILLGLGAFYFVKPYVSQLKEAYGFIGGSDSDTVNELIKQFKGEDN